MTNSTECLISLRQEQPSGAGKENKVIFAVLPQITEGSMCLYNTFLLKLTNFQMLIFSESYSRELLYACRAVNVLTNIIALSQ